MRHLVFLFCALVSLGAISPARAADHANVDAGRPLDFEDAETVAFREKTLEFGGALVKPKIGKTGVAGEAEFVWGFWHNWQLNAGIDPGFRAQNSANRRFDIGDFSLGAQHNLNRETEKLPAFALRADAIFPTGRDSKGTDFRLRAIASRHFGTYGRLHLNLDWNRNARPQIGERRDLTGAILGYSAPLGFPKRFDRTGLAQIGVRAAPARGQSALWNAGIGLRQQISPRSVVDFGLKTDFAGSHTDREKLQIIAGYSTAF